MKTAVVIFGANGFLGRYLCRHFVRQGREVVAVGRRKEDWSGDGMFLEWDGKTIGPWALALEGAGLVINLAGRSVDCRYTEENRREILDSRIAATRVIGEAIAACEAPPAVWMNAGTATWYRHAEDRPQDEFAGEPGEGFSVEVARRWEQAFFTAKTPGHTRKLALRIGMVMANEPDTVADVLGKLVRRGLGGRMGSGKQRVSWIHMDDFLEIISRLEADPLADGVFNVTAPEAPTNAEMMLHFREIQGMPVGLPAEEWMLKLGALLMRTETELVLKSRWAEPGRLLDDGYRWRWPEMGPALHDLESRRGLNGFFRVPARRAFGARVWTTGGRLRTT
ncbi:TIGR01777 family oxidoreductase [Haloferula sp.]|uniref:TIGR01777 family oxidoreductase n=1 Tax=Haloferula sp. TaxID=2497595 RepID=UPI00329DE3D3